MFSSRILQFTILLALLWPIAAWPQEFAPQDSLGGALRPAKIFLIGNSLTWDTLPGLLDGEVQWHVDCGKNLKEIWEHPESPCVKTSTLWPAALKAEQYDFLCVQPHYGTSLAEDVAVISEWLELQPTATLVIHTGWPRSADFEADYHAQSDMQQMVHSPAYFQALSAQLLEKHPGRTIRSTAAIDVLDVIWHEIQHGGAPFGTFQELFRDEIHVTTQVGRYLMHNLMRTALQQPLSSQGFHIDAAQKEFLDHKINSIGLKKPAA